ncbi:hypothetical protein DPMN_081143 [Dreissena polymorpha]|uniref:Uncharacterized protein n=1 Tax=Dreissena polymorpha TaxID=45954 RepID=A0A9D3Y4K4_DREPO|nr:hypothetical protein DPMN_081143 [Dreissena polymorpha]
MGFTKRTGWGTLLFGSTVFSTIVYTYKGCVLFIPSAEKQTQEEHAGKQPPSQPQLEPPEGPEIRSIHTGQIKRGLSLSDSKENETFHALMTAFPDPFC